MLKTERLKFELFPSLDWLRYKFFYIKRSNLLSQVCYLWFSDVEVTCLCLKSGHKECPDFGAFPFSDVWILDIHCRLFFIWIEDMHKTSQYALKAFFQKILIKLKKKTCWHSVSKLYKNVDYLFSSLVFNSCETFSQRWWN